LVYNDDGTTTVTDALGNTQTHHFETYHGVARISRIDGGSCQRCDSQSQNMTYDANGFIASRTDFNGNRTTYTRTARGLETARTEAAGTPEARTITTDWHPTFRLPTRITESGKQTRFTYDDNGRLLSRSETDTTDSIAPRTTTMTYTGTGAVGTINGPRTDVDDVTAFIYDTNGKLIVTRNALGQETYISAYDANGHPLTLVDANGTQTTLSYDARGRLLTRSVDGQTTTFEYDAVGNLIRTTLPTGVFLLNEYDSAQRLIAVEDALGNRIEYTLDNVGNRIREDVKDPQGNLSRTLSRTYNKLNQLIETLGGAGQHTTYAYDANGNQTTMTVDPNGLNRRTRHTFDALNRIKTITDTGGGVTTYRYDARDNLLGVTDANGNTNFPALGLKRVPSCSPYWPSPI